MTSPAIKNNEKSRKTLRKNSSNGSQDTSGASSSGGTVAASTTALAQAPDYSPAGLFSWLRVFRFANLLMRQGC